MHPKTQSLAPGTEASFRVQATGYCLQFQWQKNNNDLSDDDRNHGTGTDTLHIVKVEKVDNKARYRCHVKNEIGKKFSKEAVLTVGKLVINAVDIFSLMVIKHDLSILLDVVSKMRSHFVWWILHT